MCYMLVLAKGTRGVVSVSLRGPDHDCPFRSSRWSSRLTENIQNGKSESPHSNSDKLQAQKYQPRMFS